jgi:hypothetical protein
MPEQTEAASEEAAREPKVRRISNKKPRKTSGGDATSKEEIAASAPDTGDSPKPDLKRGNRRRRGKGKSVPKEAEPSPAEEPFVEETISLAPEESDTRPEKKDKPEPHRDKPQDIRPQQHQKPRRNLDPEKVAKNAWKIFLAEVSEEGVALIGDNDARELARRCFRLSEIFLEEEQRRG